MHEKLQMKKLDESHLEQYNELLRYAFQVTENDLSRVGWEEEEIRASKSPVLKGAYVLGWFEGQKLASQIATYPLKMNIRGSIYKMGLVTGVATYPEYAGMGLMSQLMKQALADMRSNDQTISLLYPYSIPFYRRKGWELISDKMGFQMKDTQLPQNLDVPGRVGRVEQDSADVAAIHDRFAVGTHGCIVRDELVWEEYWRWEVSDVNVAVYYDSCDAPQGYMVYLLQNDIFYIKEIVCLEYEAWKGLWNYVTAHESMLELVKGSNYYSKPIAFWLPDSEIKETIRPYMMGRIVDAEKFLQNYHFRAAPQDKELTFLVDDPLLEWNQNAFTVSFKKGATQVKAGKQTDNIVKLSIGTLTTLLMGYQNARYLQTIEKLQAEDEIVEFLHTVVSDEKAYISDYI